MVFDVKNDKKKEEVKRKSEFGKECVSKQEWLSHSLSNAYEACCCFTNFSIRLIPSRIVVISVAYENLK